MSMFVSFFLLNGSYNTCVIHTFTFSFATLHCNILLILIYIHTLEADVFTIQHVTIASAYFHNHNSVLLQGAGSHTLNASEYTEAIYNMSTSKRQIVGLADYRTDQWFSSFCPIKQDKFKVNCS